MNKFFSRIFNLSCFYYMIVSFVLNFIAWIFSENNHNRMLTIWANLVLYLICFIASIFLLNTKRKLKSNTSKIDDVLYKYGIYKSGIIYTLVFFVLNTTQYIIKVENFWNGYSIMLIILFSAVSTFLILKVKFKSFLVCSILNYFIIGIFYYIFFVVKANFKNGNALLISIGVYTTIYIICSIVYYLLIAKKQSVENSEQNYKNLFS